MSKAAELAALIGSQSALSNRNLIINGSSQVWQRGTSVDTIATGGYLCDRWRVAYAGTDGNVDVDQDTSVPTGQGFSYSQKISMDASESSLDAGDQVNVTQRIEAQNLQHLEFGTSSAKSLVVSFWVKSSVAATYSLEWLTQDGTQRMIGRTYTINSADTWEYKTLTIPGDPSATIDNNNGVGLDIRWWLDAGSTFTGGTFATDWENKTDANRVNATTGWLVSTSPTWHITGIQLEIGDVATPFEHRSFGDELARCQRYYRKVNTLNPTYLLTVRSSDDVRRLSHVFSTMRASPTGAIVASGGGTVTVQGTGTDSIQFTVSGQSTSDAPYIADYTLDSEL